MSKLNREREKALSQELLKQKLTYDPLTGLFRWKESKGRAKAGAVAGSIDSHNYWIIGLNGSYFRGHRLAFLYMTGEWPSEFVDHIDGNPRNNRWSNLRQATKKHNALNKKMSVRNTTGWQGVSYNPAMKRYQAIITKDGKRSLIGYYDCPEEAGLARMKAAEELYGSWARTA